jgi:hypothetical protein
MIAELEIFNGTKLYKTYDLKELDVVIDNFDLLKLLKCDFICQLQRIYFPCTFSEEHGAYLEVAKLAGKQFIIQCKNKEEVEKINTQIVLYSLQKD